MNDKLWVLSRLLLHDSIANSCFFKWIMGIFFLNFGHFYVFWVFVLFSLSSKKVWVIIIKIMTNPPIIVFIDGCSLITNQTQIGPRIVSKIKNISTSYAGIYLGAMVIHAKGIIRNKPIIIIKNNWSELTKSYLGNESINAKAIKIVNNLAIKSEGRKSNDLL